MERELKRRALDRLFEEHNLEGQSAEAIIALLRAMPTDQRSLLETHLIIQTNVTFREYLQQEEKRLLGIEETIKLVRENHEHRLTVMERTQASLMNGVENIRATMMGQFNQVGTFLDRLHSDVKASHYWNAFIVMLVVISVVVMIVK